MASGTRPPEAIARGTSRSTFAFAIGGRVVQYWAVSGRRGASRRTGRAVAEGAVAAAAFGLAAAIPVLGVLKLRDDAMWRILAAAALLGVLAQRFAALRNRKEKEREREALLDDALAWWPAPLVQKADPYELGAFPPGTGVYSTRGVDAELDAALGEPGYVLVIGPVGSGKSRAAFAAVRRRLGKAKLLVPEDAESLGKLVAVDPPPAAGQQAVLWLDCVDRFLGGMRLDALDRWIRDEGIRVVATIADEQVAEILHSPGAEGHVARRLFARARATRVERPLTPAELVAVRERFPDDSFEQGIGDAFRPHWQPGGKPAFTAPEPEPERRRLPRPDLAIAAALIAIVVLTVMLAELWSRYDGFEQPAALAEQITKLDRDLGVCAQVVGSEKAVNDGTPVVAIINSDPDCASWRPAAQNVALYDEKYDVLERIGGFAPPRTGPLAGAGFACLGDTTETCWTDLMGDGTTAMVGAFRSPTARVVLPVVAWRDKQSSPQLMPVLGVAPRLAPRFQADVYRRPVALGVGRGHVATETVVLPPDPRDGTVLPARLVAAYAPEGVAPKRFEFRAYLLRRRTRFETVEACHVVRRGVVEPNPVLRLRNGERLSTALRARWLRLERAGQGICVVDVSE
jgi:hypothetical protein